MRFLLDECLSIRLAPLLAEAGHDVVHVFDRDLAGHVDDEVLAAALHEERVLVSADTDFGELLAKQGLALPSLVLFRQGNRGGSIKPRPCSTTSNSRRLGRRRDCRLHD